MTGKYISVLSTLTLYVAVFSAAAWIGCQKRAERTAENATEPMELAYVQWPPPSTPSAGLIADFAQARPQPQWAASEVSPFHGPERLKGVRDCIDFHVPPRGDAPGYLGVRYVLRRGGYVGVVLELRPGVLKEAAIAARRQGRPLTHLRILARSGPLGAGPWIGLELNSKEDYYRAAIDAIDRPHEQLGRQWTWLSIPLTQFRGDVHGKLPPDLEGINRLALVFDDHIRQEEGELHLAYVTLANNMSWTPPTHLQELPLPEDAAAIDTDAGLPALDANASPPAAGATNKRSERTTNDTPEYVLFDLSTGANRRDQFGSSWGSWQAEKGGPATTTDKLVQSPPGYLRLDYRVPQDFVGHFFLIDGERLQAAVKAGTQPTHLQLRLRASEFTRRLKIELKQPEPCAMYLDADREREHEIKSEFTDLLIPLEEFAGFDPSRFDRLKELNFVYEAAEVTRTAGSADLQRISLVARKP